MTDNFRSRTKRCGTPEGVKQRCIHYACRCRRAAELAAMGNTVAAIEVWQKRPVQEVECQQNESAEGYPFPRD